MLMVIENVKFSFSGFDLYGGYGLPSSRSDTVWCRFSDDPLLSVPIVDVGH